MIFFPVVPSAEPKGSAESWAWYREENDWGFFRNTRAGLGKTGINRAFVGRKNAGLNIGSLGKKQRADFTIVMKSLWNQKDSVILQVMKLLQIMVNQMGLKGTFIPLMRVMYTIVWLILLDHHGDLRVHVSVLACDKADFQEKRRFSMNFIINFTKKDFTSFLD